MANRNIEINYKTESGYDVLYPKGITTNIILEDGEILETTINDIQNKLNDIYASNIGEIEIKSSIINYSGSGTSRPTNATSGRAKDYNIDLTSTIFLYFVTNNINFGGDFGFESQVTPSLFDTNGSGSSTFVPILQNGDFVFWNNYYWLKNESRNGDLMLQTLRIGVTTAYQTVSTWSASFKTTIYSFNLVN